MALRNKDSLEKQSFVALVSGTESARKLIAAIREVISDVEGSLLWYVEHVYPPGYVRPWHITLDSSTYPILDVLGRINTVCFAYEKDIMQELQEQTVQQSDTTWTKSRNVVQAFMADLLEAGVPREQIFERAYAVAYGVISSHDQTLKYSWEYDLAIAKMLREVADLIGLSHRSRRRMLDEQYARSAQVMEAK